MKSAFWGVLPQLVEWRAKSRMKLAKKAEWTRKRLATLLNFANFVKSVNKYKKQRFGRFRNMIIDNAINLLFAKLMSRGGKKFWAINHAAGHKV